MRSADPRTSSEVISDLNDVIEKVPIIWLPPVIPNLNPPFQQKWNWLYKTEFRIFAKLSREAVGKSLLSQMLDYEIAQLEPLHDTSYQSLRDLLTPTNVRLADLVR